VPDDTPFDALQFTSNEVESILQDLDVNKGSGPDHFKKLCICFRKTTNTSFKQVYGNECLFRQVEGFIFKKGRRNNVEDVDNMAGLYYLQFRSVLNCCYIEECTTT
jgi:hypothetical protein